MFLYFYVNWLAVEYARSNLEQYSSCLDTKASGMWKKIEESEIAWQCQEDRNIDAVYRGFNNY